ncbi:Rho termination factor N-terminal domain-containing protein [Amycolatopsis aidingensis]|uniref:Rho termination factor N-terminal domain-containing protein n=1 Tax=Amycolatopsis aidingensis TaxID=2842453 RepID=UPI001E36D0E5|nr:Rho termination factor N-terminal domain-containing protein [Amycolatopsis aidingensis]
MPSAPRRSPATAQRNWIEAHNSAERVDASAGKEALYRQAARLGVRGRSSMTKQQLVDALRRANTRGTATART